MSCASGSAIAPSKVSRRATGSLVSTSIGIEALDCSAAGAQLVEHRVEHLRLTLLREVQHTAWSEQRRIAEARAGGVV